jgi:hypothetical protein
MSDYPKWINDLLRRGGYNPDDVSEVRLSWKRNDPVLRADVRVDSDPEHIEITISKTPG